MTLIISQHQLDMLTEARLPDMEAPLLAHVRRAFPVDLNLLGEAQVLVLARLALRRARRHRLTTLGEVCRYLDAMIAHGSHFDEDPLLPWAAAALSQPGSSADRMAALGEDSLAWIGIAAGETGRPAIRSLLRLRDVTPEALESLRPSPDPADAGPLPDPAAPPRAPSPAPDADRTALRMLLCDLHPERVRAAGLEALDVALDAALAGAAAAGLPGRLGRHIHAVLAVMLGAGYARDPQRPWAAAALRMADPEERAQALVAAGHQAIDLALGQMRRPGQG